MSFLHLEHSHLTKSFRFQVVSAKIKLNKHSCGLLHAQFPTGTHAEHIILCSGESHTQRTPSQELQSPGLGRHQDPAAAPGLGPLVRLQAILAHELADWLGARSATKRARRLVRHPLRALCGSVRSHSSSAPIRRTLTSASTCSIAATHAGDSYALIAHCRPPFFFCQWVLQVTRTSEAHTHRGRLHHSHRASYFLVSYVYSKVKTIAK